MEPKTTISREDFERLEKLLRSADASNDALHQIQTEALSITREVEEYPADTLTAEAVYTDEDAVSLCEKLGLTVEDERPA